MLEKLTASTWYRFRLLLRTGVLVALPFERRAAAADAAASAMVAALAADLVSRHGVLYGSSEFILFETETGVEGESAAFSLRVPPPGRSHE